MGIVALGVIAAMILFTLIFVIVICCVRQCRRQNQKKSRTSKRNNGPAGNNESHPDRASANNEILPNHLPAETMDDYMDTKRNMCQPT